MLEVKALKKHFAVKRGFWGNPTSWLHAADEVSFSVSKGEVLGIVGESGCGKTTVGKMIAGLLEPTSGEIVFEGVKTTGKRRDIQFIFQDPYGSLNPRMTIKQTLTEPLMIHHLMKKNEMSGRVDQLMECVGLAPYHKERFPHEFSGGQRQRVGIARALACDPRFIVCDEPVSALDVSIQAQILNLLADLKDMLGLTYIFIAHGLAAVKHLSGRICVMYLGKVVELTDKHELYQNPQHPYTKALLSAIPTSDPTRKKQRVLMTGDLPSPIDPAPGCRFASRCSYCEARCREAEPALREIAPGHLAACHLL